MWAAWGGGKRLDGMSPGRPQSFRYKRQPMDDCSPGRGGIAQDGRIRGDTFHGKTDRCRKARAGPRHAVVCSNVTGRAKDKIAQSKRARADSLDIVG